MTSRSSIVNALAGAALVLGAAVQPASAEQTLDVGILECKAVPGTRVNLLIRSTTDIECTFNTGSVVEKYRGETGIALGLDLSFRKNEQFAFSVVTTSDKYKPHSLTGKYVGARATATAGVGLGAAALIGGSDDTFGLNPLALEANQGFGLSGGIGFLYIEPMK